MPRSIKPSSKQGISLFPLSPKGLFLSVPALIFSLTHTHKKAASLSYVSYVLRPYHCYATTQKTSVDSHRDTIPTWTLKGDSASRALVLLREKERRGRGKQHSLRYSHFSCNIRKEMACRVKFGRAPWKMES